MAVAGISCTDSKYRRSNLRVQTFPTAVIITIIIPTFYHKLNIIWITYQATYQADLAVFSLFYAMKLA